MTGAECDAIAAVTNGSGPPAVISPSASTPPTAAHAQTIPSARGATAEPTPKSIEMRPNQTPVQLYAA